VNPPDAEAGLTGPQDSPVHTVPQAGPSASTLTPAPAAPAVEVPDYRIDGELARGGMGIVYRATDLRLNRSVAVKVLQERFGGSPLAAARFLEEAQITAQLQHPGIPPVHQVGVLADGRPFLAMKLIRGNTLVELLRDPKWDRGQVVSVFEQVCQAVAYAHGHGVIHRDLKPANVMVGAFGEVQVMDWGLAKVRAAAAERPAPAGPTMTAVRNPRAATDELATGSGTAMGTPAYMAPEQAVGAVEEIDERSDVFGLGGILCEALTGKPPYAGGDAESTRRLAAQAKLGDAHARLDSSGADPELVALCKRCLSPEPPARPADAGEVARAVAALRAAADERARTADLDRARAEGDLRAAAEAAKRRRLRLVLAAAIALFVGVAGAGVWWQRTVERERATRDVDAVEAALGQAEAALRADDATLAAARLEEAERRLGPGGPAALRERFERLRADQTLLAELDRIDDLWWTWSPQRVGWKEAPKELPAAFRQYGVDPGQGDPAEAAHRIAESLVRDRLLSGLHRWLAWRAEPGLLDLLERLDPDRFRSEVRRAVADGDRTRVLALGDREEAIRQPAWFATAFANTTLLPVGRAEQILLAAHRQQPGDYWLLMTLGNLEVISDGDVARRRMGWLQAALAVRPKSAVAWNCYAVARYYQGEFDAAVAAYLEAIRLNGRYPDPVINLAIVLNKKGDTSVAVAVLREAVRLAPDVPEPHHYLSHALRAVGDLQGALESSRRAASLARAEPGSHQTLAARLAAVDDWPGAVAEYREALRLGAAEPSVFHKLGNALERIGDRAEALVAYRDAVRHGSTDDALYANLARALLEDGDVGGAVSALREAIRLGPKDRDQFQSLVDSLQEAGDKTGVLAASRAAVARDPADPYRQRNLAEALLDAGEPDAIVPAREAVRRMPADPSTHYVLGLVLTADGDLAGAVAADREAIRLDPRNPDSHNNLAYLLAAGPNSIRSGPGALEHATRACELSKWENADYLNTVGIAWAAVGDFAKAIEYQRKALADPGFEKQRGKEGRDRLELYRQRKAYYDLAFYPHETAPPPRVVGD
jgi:tetratricopeptide (TPR) repeat protein